MNENEVTSGIYIDGILNGLCGDEEQYKLAFFLVYILLMSIENTFLVFRPRSDAILSDLSC